MKNFGRLFGVLFAFACGLIAFQATGNPIAGALAVPLASYAFQHATGISYQLNGMFCTLAAIPKTTCGVGNPGGVQKLFLIATDQITGKYPKPTDVTAGELTVAPTIANGGTFVEIAISDNSGKTDSALKGAIGYQSWEQMLETKIAGYTKEQVAAVEKLINTEVLGVAVLNDGTRQLIGASYNGLTFEITHTSGAKGSDRREWTIKAKQDGYMQGILPIASSVTLPGISA